MISLRSLTLRRGAKLLLNNVDLTLFAGHKVGLVGANGVGKSSLFALLRGELHPDGGDIEISRNLTIAHVAQETPALDCSAIDYVLLGDAELTQLQIELEAAEAAHDGMMMGEVHEKFAAIDGYSARARAAKLLAGLGFSEEGQQGPVSAFSGGWRMRLNLAQALICRSDILLLDEPTNHLDLETVVWLESWLKSYPGLLVLISHDRDFLDNIVNSIVHAANQTLTLYTGSYTDFERQKAERLMQQQSAYERQQRDVAHLQSYIDRFKAQATKARQAQSRIKALERMERIAEAQADSPFSFSFREPISSPNPLLAMDHVSVGYGTKPILSDIKLSVESGARIGLLGVNGAGKSTLIKMLAGEMAPLTGTRTEAKGLVVGYFAQHQLEQLDPKASALLHMHRIDPKTREQEFRNFLGGFNFNGDMATTPVAPFSGGEKSRLALALLIWQRPNLLLLDEPTNHLDLEMRDALTFALQDFTGSLIVVSHDRHLLRATTNDFWLVEGGVVQPFDGDLDDYSRFRAETDLKGRQALAAPAAKVVVQPEERKNQRRDEAANRQQQAAKQKPLKQKMAKLEAELEALTIRKADVDNWLASESAYAPENKNRLQAKLKEASDIAARQEATELEWLEVSSELEALG